MKSSLFRKIYKDKYISYFMTHPSKWKFPESVENRFSKQKEIHNSNQCSICGRSFGTSELLQRHTQGHIASARDDGLVPFFKYKKSDPDHPTICFRSIQDRWN